MEHFSFKWHHPRISIFALLIYFDFHLCSINKLFHLNHWSCHLLHSLIKDSQSCRHSADKSLINASKHPFYSFLYHQFLCFCLNSSVSYFYYHRSYCPSPSTVPSCSHLPSWLIFDCLFEFHPNSKCHHWLLYCLQEAQTSIHYYSAIFRFGSNACP